MVANAFGAEDDAVRDESFFTAKIAEASQSSLRTTKTSCANPVFLGDLCG